MSDRHKLSKRIVEAVIQMPSKVRRVFILSHYRGLSPRRISEILGIQENEIKSLLKRGNTLLSRTVPVP